MDKEQRAIWGPLIREARERAGLTQEELADAANTTRRTIGSIELGRSVGQQAILDRTLAVLGLSDGTSWDEDVEALLAMLGPLIQTLPPAERPEVMAKVVTLIVQATIGSRSNVVTFPNEKASVSADTTDDLELASDEDSMANIEQEQWEQVDTP